jgi:hypothetical protein
MLFDFLTSKKTKNDSNDDNSETLAKVSYIINKSSESIIVDVELSEYTDECIQSLCEIIDILSSEKSILDTVDIIKNAMVSDGKQDSLVKFFTYLDIETKTKLLNINTKDDEPCIKPSEVFLK